MIPPIIRKLLDQLTSLAQGQDIEQARDASIVLSHMDAVDVCADVIQVNGIVFDLFGLLNGSFKR